MRVFSRRGFVKFKLTDLELSTLLTCLALAKANWHRRDKEVTITEQNVNDLSVELFKQIVRK